MGRVAELDGRVYATLNAIDGLSVYPVAAVGDELDLPCAVFRINGGTHERTFRGYRMTAGRYEIVLTAARHDELGDLLESVLTAFDAPGIAVSGPVDSFLDATGVENDQTGLFQRRLEISLPC